MAEISAKAVKELREKTSAGMMDCKKALAENDGDMDKAVDWLRKKNLARADKQANKVAAEGLVGQYIHTGGRIGVLVEINCQTDFVSRNDAFKELVSNIAMQIAACPNVDYVRLEDIPEDVVAKEKAIEMGKDDLAGKKEDLKEKIVAGRIEKNCAYWSSPLFATKIKPSPNWSRASRVNWVRTFKYADLFGSFWVKALRLKSPTSPLKLLPRWRVANRLG
jgi:elongation factor Ts